MYLCIFFAPISTTLLLDNTFQFVEARTKNTFWIFHSFQAQVVSNYDYLREVETPMVPQTLYFFSDNNDNKTFSLSPSLSPPIWNDDKESSELKFLHETWFPIFPSNKVWILEKKPFT